MSGDCPSAGWTDGADGLDTGCGHYVVVGNARYVSSSYPVEMCCPCSAGGLVYTGTVAGGESDAEEWESSILVRVLSGDYGWELCVAGCWAGDAGPVSTEDVFPDCAVVHG